MIRVISRTISALAAVIGASVLLGSPVAAEAPQAFTTAIASGDLNAAQATLSDGAEVTEFDEYNGVVRTYELWILLENTKKMERAEDFAEFKATDEGQTRGRFDQGVAFWYGPDSRLTKTRFMIEFVTDENKVSAVHAYWVGPVPPPVPAMPPRSM